ncbi:hypothetical protein [Teredinibacter turnerae]|uniref:hypothetical protein n=1 Tax=Teredinibacter turnerae TaxID=2426 RepID=UPI0030CBBDF4
MNEIDYLNKALSKVTDKLNSYSLNYVADVMIYPVSESAAGSVGEIVKSVFGSAVLGGASESNTHELHEELLSGLSYAGDSGAYANKKYVGSSEHVRDLQNITNKLKPVLTNCSSVTSFWLKEGHPFYPVFWDFAFLVEGGNKFIIIGSSSD